MGANRQKPEPGGMNPLLKAMLWGTCAACAVCGILLLAMAVIVTLRDIPLGAIDPMMITAAALGALAGGYVCARRVHEKGMLLGLCCAAAEFLLLFLFSFTIAGQTLDTLLFVKLFALLLCGAAGGIVGVNRRVRHK